MCVTKDTYVPTSFEKFKSKRAMYVICIEHSRTNDLILYMKSHIICVGERLYESGIVSLTKFVTHRLTQNTLKEEKLVAQPPQAILTYISDKVNKERMPNFLANTYA